ncbi:discoidin domain-containing protein [Catellatospora coxensis]
MDARLHHDHRHRRHADPQRHRLRPVRAHARHRAQQRLRLLVVRVQGHRLVRAPTSPSANPGACGTTNVAQGKTATASSVENAGTPASAAVDGNAGTRWSSQYADPQWLQIDLGSTQSICQVVLQWEGAYATAFQLQTSATGTGGWTSIYSTTTGPGGTQTLNVGGSGRYLRMYGTTRANGYGYSLWEFKVFTGGVVTSPSASPSGTPNTSPSPSGNWTTVWEENFDGAAAPRRARRTGSCAPARSTRAARRTGGPARSRPRATPPPTSTSPVTAS